MVLQQESIVPANCSMQWTIGPSVWTTVDVVYLSFHKAFETVPHKHLLSKLHGYGIQGNLLSWIEAFLTGRKQRVVLNGHCSIWSDVVSGVPQGLSWGLCFLTYNMSMTYLILLAVPSYFLLMTSKFNISKCNILHLELHISSAPITFALLSGQYYQSGTLVSQLMKILNFMSTLYLWPTKLTVFLGWSKEVLPVWTLTCWFIFINLQCDLYLSMQIQYGALTT